MKTKLLSLALAACVWGAAPGFAQELDTSKLPRTGSAKPLYASPLSTIYNTPEPVAAAADIVKGLLAAQGWKPYSDPFAQAANIPSQQITNYKKGGQAVTVFIRTTPPPSNTTGVTYNRIPLANDLPFPDDATDIGFAPDRPHLQLRTGRGVEATLAYFRKEMARARLRRCGRARTRRSRPAAPTAKSTTRPRMPTTCRTASGRCC